MIEDLIRPIEIDTEEAEKIYWNFEIKLMSKFLVVNPDDLEALHSLAHALTHAGRHTEALAVDLKIKGKTPADPIVHYNIACDYSNLGMIDEALDYLEKAIDLGYREFDYMLRDPDLANLRKDPRFFQLIEKYIGKKF